MKAILLLLFFVTAGFGVLAQRSTFTKEITTDGHQLRIRMEMDDNTRSMQYSRSFDISNLSDAEAKILESRIVDSLEVVMRQPVRSTQTGRKAQKTESVTGRQEQVSDADRTETVVTASTSQIPYEETVEENLPEGRLKVGFTFRVDGQLNLVERTAIVCDSSERGLRKLRAEIKRQLTEEMERLMRTAEEQPI